MTTHTNEQRIRKLTNYKFLQIRVEEFILCSKMARTLCGIRTAFSYARGQMPHMPPELPGAHNHTGISDTALFCHTINQGQIIKQLGTSKSVVEARGRRAAERITCSTRQIRRRRGLPADSSVSWRFLLVMWLGACTADNYC